MSEMDRITEKHPALSLGDLKFAGEFLEEICDCDNPKETALLAESLLWRHLNKTSNRKRSTFKELILACFFIAIKLEDRDIARNSQFLDTISSPVQRLDILQEELGVLQSVNWRPLEHWRMIAKESP